MSFYTSIEIVYLNDEEIHLDSFKTEILTILKQDAIHFDVYSNLKNLFENNKSDFNLDAVYCYELLQKVSKLFPEVSFSSRGLGEELIFTWVCVFEDGKISFQNLAWETDNPLI